MPEPSPRRRQLHRKVDVRKSHPSLYHLIMAVATGSIALGVNFWTSNPTFNPYGWSHHWIGVVFFIIGTAQALFLNIWRDLRLVRIALMLSSAFYVFWGGTNTQQFFNGNASLQLPIMFMIVAAVQALLLLEAPVNPMTEKDR
jgi:hypothetical protein